MGFNSLSSDTIQQKQMQAYNTAAQMTEDMQKFLEGYKERLQKRNEKRLKQTRESNTKSLQKKILGVDTKMVPNAENIIKNLDSISSLKRLYFGIKNNYDTSLDPVIWKILQQQRLLEQTLYEIKKGQNDNYNINLREQNAFDFSNTAARSDIRHAGQQTG